MQARRLLLDESGQILRHVIIIGLTIVVIVLILAEAGPIIWVRFSSIQDAEDIANTAAWQYKVFGTEREAINEVAAKMKSMGYSDEEIRESLSTLVFLPEGPGPKTAVKVTVIKYTSTLIIRHINALKRFSRVATTKQVEISTASEKQ